MNATLKLYPSGVEIGTIELTADNAPNGGIGTVPLSSVRDDADLNADYRNLPDDQLVYSD